MQTIATETIPNIEAIEQAHEQAQGDSNIALTKACHAIQGAQSAGRLLISARDSFKRRIDFEIWLHQNASKGLQEWSDRYLRVAQLELPLNFGDASPAALRQSMLILEIVPMVERTGADHSDDSGKFERSLFVTVEKLQKFFGKIPKENGRLPESKKEEYKIAFKQIHQWLSNEVFDEV